MSSTVLLMFPALMVLIFLGFPVAFSMMLTVLGFGLLRFGDTLVHQLVSKVDEVSSNYVLGAIPLFIFMGSILERAGIAERLFDALFLWTRRLPGGLAIAALLMCTIFAAASGVVGATETLVGMIAIPAMMKRNYQKPLIAGTICGGGSLGTIIPPSVPVVVLAPIASLPVGDLLAGILFPGLLMSGLFILYILIACGLNPKLAPPVIGEDRISFLDKLKLTAMAIIPPGFLIFMVLGTLFFGLATPTEAAACGSLGVILLALLYRQLTLGLLLRSALQTVSITAMILLIVLAGSMFSGVFFASGGMAATNQILQGFGLSSWAVMAVILAVTFLLGFVLDLISIILIVVPLAIPLVKSFGIDPLWFAVVMLVVLQTSYLTPPMAPSIFYLRAIAPPSIRLRDMYWGVIPFIGCQILTLLVILLFPTVATWLPKAMYGLSLSMRQLIPEETMTTETAGEAKILGPNDGKSFWQPVPANGFVRNLFSDKSIASRNNFSIGTQTVAPRSFIREHTHDRNEEIIFVVKGKGICRLDGEEHVIEEGSCVFIGHNRRHHFLNPHDEPMTFLWVFMPGGLDDFFEQIGRPRKPGDPTPEPFARPDNVAEIEARTVFGWTDASYNTR